eukprot:TRINITY_DN7744_c0_g1_i1.p1 TRINITY_DN7744_c0_g1~~TRINITY_DN7744_c0_g1_i1.p1  ORF type:complete len:253 (-),score=28.38 TRINITY_DN7744_c0_g1_i1:64-822(-)
MSLISSPFKRMKKFVHRSAQSDSNQLIGDANPPVNNDATEKENERCPKNIKRLLQTTYSGMSGHGIPLDERKLIDITHKSAETYGEIHYSAVTTMINTCNPNTKDVFYDLGSGMGKVAIQFALQTDCMKCCGLELSQTRHSVAQLMVDVIIKKDPRFQPNLKKKLQFLNQDFLSASWKDATILYTCWTVFPKNIQMKMVDKAYKCPRLRFFVAQEPISWDQTKFVLVKKQKIQVSWDDARPSLYFYKKAGSP